MVEGGAVGGVGVVEGGVVAGGVGLTGGLGVGEGLGDVGPGLGVPGGFDGRCAGGVVGVCDGTGLKGDTGC